MPPDARAPRDPRGAAPATRADRHVAGRGSRKRSWRRPPAAVPWSQRRADRPGTHRPSVGWLGDERPQRATSSSPVHPKGPNGPRPTGGTALGRGRSAVDTRGSGASVPVKEAAMTYEFAIHHTPETAIISIRERVDEGDFPAFLGRAF